MQTADSVYTEAEKQKFIYNSFKLEENKIQHIWGTSGEMFQLFLDNFSMLAMYPCPYSVPTEDWSI